MTLKEEGIFNILLNFIESINVGDGSSMYVVQLGTCLSLLKYTVNGTTTTTYSESKGEDGTECDGVSEVVVIAATNRLEDLDEAVVRRFESKIFIGPPDRTSRYVCNVM